MDRVKERNFCELRYVIAKDTKGHMAAGYDQKGKQICRTDYGTLDEVEREVIQKLGDLSGEFVSIGSAMNLFRKAFPKGFSDPYYMYYEGEYKREASELTQELLSKEAIQNFLSEGNISEIIRRTKKCYSKTNVLSPFESAKLGDFFKNDALSREFAELLPGFLFGSDFPQAFKDMADLLERGGVNKWPVITYLPFMSNPKKHMFLKPEVTKKCAERMAFDLGYDPKPNMDTYERLIKFAAFVFKGTEAMSPTNNIDIQSFLYVVGNEDYVREAVMEREKFGDSQSL